MRMTRQRKMILDILNKASIPLSAEMIFQDIKDENLNLSTVYRTLDAFFAEGVLSKSTMKNTQYYYVNHRHHHHYMICISCQKMYELDCHIDDFAMNIASQHDFTITHHDMTVYGYCKDCQQQHQ